MAYILGLNAFHGDSSASLLVDGRLVAAVEEERFRRIKHWAGFPAQAIKYCLSEAQLGLDDIDIVAINSDPKSCFWRKVAYTIAGRPNLSLIAEKIRTRNKRNTVDNYLSLAVPGARFSGQIVRIEHHLAHLASCHYASPFEESVAVSVDGFGDFSSAAWGVGKGKALRLDGRVYFPHSLGVFYQALTQYLGFPNYGDEYKVMGLAPYGVPTYIDQVRKLVRLNGDGSFKLDLSYFRHHRNKIGYEWVDAEPRVSQLYSRKLESLMGPARNAADPLTQRHKDIARSVQQAYEEALFHLLGRLYERYGVDQLALAGGCAMNSVANGKIKDNTPFKKVYIQPAAGDAGGAVGAAFVAAARTGENLEGSRMHHAYWGPQFSDSDIRSVLDAANVRLEEEKVVVEVVENEDELCNKTADAIERGKVVGWFQGRMEWGPRALGNRSIVCDPRRSDMKELLNRKIKRRESFRPFAPSILREKVSEWFEENDDVPFMMKVYKIKEEKRKEIPAVTHVDGTGRLQTVYNSTNPKYYMLIKAFEKRTGVPMVLNTSFNENEPVVCLPKEALDCFLRTKMDILVMESYYLERRGSETGEDV